MRDGQGISMEELTTRTGITSRTVRFYIAENLLLPPKGKGRGASYPEEYVVRIQRILEMKASGKSLEAIRNDLSLLASPPEIPTTDAILAPQISESPEDVPPPVISAKETPRTETFRPGPGVLISIELPLQNVKLQTLDKGAKLLRTIGALRSGDEAGVLQGLAELLDLQPSELP